MKFIHLANLCATHTPVRQSAFAKVTQFPLFWSLMSEDA